MIIFENIDQSEPYIKFQKYYERALQSNQDLPEAMLVSSYSIENKEVDCRYVNLKYVINKNFIFFSNYESPKAQQFNQHDQISVAFYWSSINVQIRMKAHIKKTDRSYNTSYFEKRDKNKNALAIASNQSVEIKSYNLVEKKYSDTLKSNDLTKCPEYWGGYKFSPYYIELWEGHDHRLNKRQAYKKNKNGWKKSYLQP